MKVNWWQTKCYELRRNDTSRNFNMVKCYLEIWFQGDIVSRRYDFKEIWFQGDMVSRRYGFKEMTLLVECKEKLTMKARTCILCLD